MTGIWDRRCWPPRAGIFDLIFSQKMGINILGGTDMDHTTHPSLFWATVCKTVRPMLSVRCLSCPVCLSVMFVHCGQTVGRIKMKLGMQVGLGPGHIVLGSDPAPLP